MKRIKTEIIPDASQVDENLPKDSEIFIRKCAQISKRIDDCVKEKGWLQKNLAEELGKTEAEISKFLSGTHNYTLRTLSKIEAILGMEIIEVANNTYSSFPNLSYADFAKNLEIPSTFMDYKHFKVDYTKYYYKLANWQIPKSQAKVVNIKSNETSTISTSMAG